MSSSTADPLADIRRRAPVEGAWLVGGSVRDMLLGRPVLDIDLVVAEDPRAVAKRLAGRCGGSPFPLSERHGAWRVVSGEQTVDIAGCRGSIEDDLGLRDFTINAIAVSLDDGEYTDPFGGREDLDRRLLRTVSDGVFADDPLRLLRLPRIAHELGFDIDPASERLASSQAELASRPSGERIFMEMRRLLGGDRPEDALRLADRIGVLEAVLPEVAPMRGVTQSGHHQLDVWEHTLHVVEGVADIAEHPEYYMPG
ncbi:MAG TPA: hypothetical protein VFW26_13715, partial [Gaiellales bacterium]|nr:hypothetical protein [Gaiellales bacterium]